MVEPSSPFGIFKLPSLGIILHVFRNCCDHIADLSSTIIVQWSVFLQLSGLVLEIGGWLINVLQAIWGSLKLYNSRIGMHQTRSLLVGVIGYAVLVCHMREFVNICNQLLSLGSWDTDHSPKRIEK
jgi:hypothetical protein